MASPTSTPIRTLRARLRGGVLGPERSPSCGSNRARWTAGAALKIKPHAAPSIIAKARVNSSTLVGNRIGNAPIMGAMRNAVVPQTAKAAPRPAPSRASSIFSESTKLTMRQRPAPSATRTAISRWRVLPRASMRFAVFPQTAKSRSSITPCKMASPLISKRCGPRGASQKARISPLIPALASG